jgi:hypothetical protein
MENIKMNKMKMNNKGLFNFVFGMIGLFILILILVVLLPVQEKADTYENVSLILDNTTTNSLERFEVNESNPQVVNIAYSFIHFILYSSFEVVKVGTKYAIENPDFINAKNLLILIIISLSIPIVYYGGLFLIILFLLLREWYLINKERRRFRR